MVKCFATTNSMTIDAKGTVSPCCKYTGHFGKLETYEHFDDINFDELTDRLAQGWTAGCSSCSFDEGNNVSSRRERYETRFTDDDFLLDLSLGNFCNLKCRMCHHSNSTAWFSDSIALGIPKKDLVSFQISKSQIDSLIAFLSTLDKRIEIELKGGEPLMHPNSKYFFQQLMYLSKTKTIKINCITNGTLVPDWFAAAVANIEVDLQISIDGLYDTYEYVRGDNTHSWKQCLEKVEQFRSLPNITVSYNYVVQNTTVHHVVQFAKLFNERINWIVLNNPEHMAVNIMPESSKQAILSQLSTLNDAKIKSVINLMKTPADPVLYKQFITYSAKLDKLRNQNLKIVLPHLLDDIGIEIYDAI
jgi:MoaA/NifB/PqqE/SkfB family radical SAM enzyme